MKLNLGSGIYPAEGFINIDVDPSVNPDMVRDVRRGLPFSANTIDEVRACHFLEHLDPSDFIFTLAEVWRVLRDGGSFDIHVPIGITDDLTHRTFFVEDSFNVFLDPSSQFYYKHGMQWELFHKEVVMQKFPTLHIKLRCRKPAATP